MRGDLNQVDLYSERKLLLVSSFSGSICAFFSFSCLLLNLFFSPSLTLFGYVWLTASLFVVFSLFLEHLLCFVLLQFLLLCCLFNEVHFIAFFCYLRSLSLPFSGK